MALLCHNIKMSLRLFQATSVAFRHKSEQKLPNYIEHATGLERKELLARAAGNDDPFGMKVFKRGAGTKDNPNLIPSFEDKRIIGCICEEDSTAINWMWVHKDEPKRCGCGHWFKIVEAKPL
ncbi:cytochrome c oxidase subunit 5B, mitochondrial-like [Argiope bruennichi]|uniref:Cytochrome c oxidase subunit 5B like protein n=1 Tax=Argiope bruennichi TaxID=94029 RepID=A0A8T0ENU4_ARGBR|nr:cytochrome c oxidase subunit 5B, mitochondrial-like [Argiope bruennichi]KAF8774185.1 Cytochrome c oxidase subunit 5B like protein [Argiope bruennichi]